MTTKLTVTALGRVTLQEGVLKHLGIQAGGKVRLDLLPNGRVELKADQNNGTWHELGGMLRAERTEHGFRSRRSATPSPTAPPRLVWPASDASDETQVTIGRTSKRVTRRLGCFAFGSQ